MNSIEQLKYPIGKFEYGNTYTNSDIQKNILSIQELPELLHVKAIQFTPQLLRKTYRPNGWTAQQVIHHIADSHINAFIRMKLTLTQNTPTINPYNQDAWANMADVKEPIEVSLKIIENIHKRWNVVLKTMTEADFKKKYYHAEYKKKVALDEFIALYTWHGKHHLAHLDLILNG